MANTFPSFPINESRDGFSAEICINSNEIKEKFSPLVPSATSLGTHRAAWGSGRLDHADKPTPHCIAAGLMILQRLPMALRVKVKVLAMVPETSPSCPAHPQASSLASLHFMDPRKPSGLLKVPQTLTQVLCSTGPLAWMLPSPTQCHCELIPHLLSPYPIATFFSASPGLAPLL